MKCGIKNDMKNLFSLGDSNIQIYAGSSILYDFWWCKIYLWHKEWYEEGFAANDRSFTKLLIIYILLTYLSFPTDETKINHLDILHNPKGSTDRKQLTSVFYLITLVATTNSSCFLQIKKKNLQA